MLPGARFREAFGIQVSSCRDESSEGLGQVPAFWESFTVMTMGFGNPVSLIQTDISSQPLQAQSDSSLDSSCGKLWRISTVAPPQLLPLVAASPPE